MTAPVIRLVVMVGCLGLGVTEAAAGTVTQVAAGGRHTCAVTSAGGVKCWGDNTYGQLGDGTTTSRSRPVSVSGLTSGVSAVAAGYYHTCALTSAGGLKCWGANGVGQLGDGTSTPPRTTPVDVLGLTSGVRSVSLGRAHTCALTTAGGVMCWGGNDYGQLGDNTTAWRSSPWIVIGLASGVMAVAAGWYHTCAVRTAGGVECWGWNIDGQLGDGTYTDRWTPVYVEDQGGPASAVTAGGYHSCARISFAGPGSLECWGGNHYGQLGDGTTTFRPAPVDVVGLPGAVVVEAAGYYFTCALTTAWGVKCWGANGVGQLGDNTTTSRSTPADVVGLTNIKTVSAGATHACALTKGGVLWCWGSNTYGQLGDGTTTTALTPVRVAELGPAAWSDVTGDGKSDVLWRHNTRGEVWIWPMDGTTIVSESYVETVDVGYQIVGIGDFDGDGKADILWRHPTNGQVWIWLMDGVTKRSQTWVDTVDVGYQIAGTGDFDGDGKADILWRHPTNGQVWIWLMDGVTKRSQTWVDTVDVGYQIVGSGDFDGDGKADILWRHPTNGQVWIWLMDGVTKRSQTWVDTVDVGYQIVGTGDHDGDGKVDILWRHPTNGQVWIWLMDGATERSVTWVDTVEVGCRIVGSGDYDGDGKADILWHHTTLGQVWVWLMDGATERSVTWAATVPDVGYQIVNPR